MSKNCWGQDCHLRCELLTSRLWDWWSLRKIPWWPLLLMALKFCMYMFAWWRRLRTRRVIINLSSAQWRGLGDFVGIFSASPEAGNEAAVPALPVFSGCSRPHSPRFLLPQWLKSRFSEGLHGLVRPESQGMPHYGGQVLRTQGLEKKPRLVKLTRNIIKKQSIFLWRHAGRSTGLLSPIPGWVSAGTANAGRPPPLATEGRAASGEGTLGDLKERRMRPGLGHPWERSLLCL